MLATTAPSKLRHLPSQKRRVYSLNLLLTNMPRTISVEARAAPARERRPAKERLAGAALLGLGLPTRAGVLVEEVRHLKTLGQRHGVVPLLAAVPRATRATTQVLSPPPLATFATAGQASATGTETPRTVVTRRQHGQVGGRRARSFASTPSPSIEGTVCQNGHPLTHAQP